MRTKLDEENLASLPDVREQILLYSEGWKLRDKERNDYNPLGARIGYRLMNDLFLTIDRTNNFNVGATYFFDRIGMDQGIEPEEWSPLKSFDEDKDNWNLFDEDKVDDLPSEDEIILLHIPMLVSAWNPKGIVMGYIYGGDLYQGWGFGEFNIFDGGGGSIFGDNEFSPDAWRRIKD